MSSSTEHATVGAPATWPTRELRSGTWTRLGADRVLGDDVTERALSALAEATRQSARSQGYAVGWSQGRRAAEEAARAEAAEEAARVEAAERRRDDEHALAVAALERAAEELQAAVAGAVDRVEGVATDVALRLARAIVDRELTVATDSGADALRRALALSPTDPVTVIRLNPADVGSAGVRDLTPPGARVVADPSVGRGDAVLETAYQVIDARVSTALDRVAEALTR